MLTLFALKRGLKKFWSFMRRYGWILILVGVLIVAFFMTGGGMAARDTIRSLWRTIGKERELHTRLVEEADKIHDDEVEEVASAGRRAVKAVKQAEEVYHERNEELDAGAKKRISKLVTKNRKDPEQAARDLADEFGFEFVE